VEEDVAGGVPSSVDADLDAVPATKASPATKEDVVDAEDDGATVAEVIATPDTTGGDDAREAIVLALLDDDVEAPRFQSRIKKGDIDEKASYF